MVWNKIKDVFTSAGERTNITGVRAGKAIFSGSLRAGDEQLESPIHGYICLAFFYRANWTAKTRDSETTRVYKQAECYAPGFWLELTDEPLWVVPKPTEPFTRQEHLDIKGADIPGLEPAEQLVRDGDRVRLHGKLHRDGEQPWLELSRMDILEARPVEASAGNRRARRKQKRDQRRSKKAKRKQR
jgi:hypothetical protein